MISVDGLSVSFETPSGPVLAVRELGFSVAAGESYGIAGESGSGKSTVLRAISGLNPHWTGNIEIEGAAQGPTRPRSFARQVQMVFQDPYGSLHPRHTVHHMLAELIKVHRLGDRERRIRDLLESVGLPLSLRYRYPHQLSGGQRQRVAIARTLVLEPKILLLDEPTSALDVTVQAEILNLLTKLRRSLSMTFVTVSHNIAVLSHMCGRVAIMNAGRIVEEVSIDRLRDGTLSHPYSNELLFASRNVGRTPRSVL